jgi:hypothetical protein
MVRRRARPGRRRRRRPLDIPLSALRPRGVGAAGRCSSAGGGSAWRRETRTPGGRRGGGVVVGGGATPAVVLRRACSAQIWAQVGAHLGWTGRLPLARWRSSLEVEERGGGGWVAAVLRPPCCSMAMRTLRV